MVLFPISGRRFRRIYPPCEHLRVSLARSANILGNCSETLSESQELSSQARETAALVASKVYYYLGQYEDALSFALRAGSSFEAERKLESSGEYVETIVCEYVLAQHLATLTPV
jgi:hypothetical protein